MDTPEQKPRSRFGVPNPDPVQESDTVRGEGSPDSQAGLAASLHAFGDTPPDATESQTRKRKWGVPSVALEPGAFRKVEGDGRAWFPADDPKDSAPDPDLTDEASSGFWRFWHSPILLSLALLGVSVCLLFVTNQLLAFIQVVENAPTPFRVTGWIAFSLLFLALLFSVIRLWWSFRRLRTNPGIALPGAPTLSSNQKAWPLVGRDGAQVETIRGIIRDYPRDKAQRKLLARGKLDFAVFEGNLAYLDRPEGLIGQDWLKECHMRYVEPLRQCANQLVHDYALRVALKTALVRNGVLDTLILWINAVLMFEELCRVFNVRTTKLNSVLMVGRLAYTTMISAKAADFIGDASDHLAEESQARIAEFLATAVGKYALKGAGEGSVNYFLFRRLGRAAASVLLPVRTSTG